MSTFVTGVYQSLLNISFKQFVFNQLRLKFLVRDLKKQYFCIQKINAMNANKYVFSQVTSFLPQRFFNRLVSKYDDRTKNWKFSHWNQMLALILVQLMGLALENLLALSIDSQIGGCLETARAARSEPERGIKNVF